MLQYLDQMKEERNSQAGHGKLTFPLQEPVIQFSQEEITRTET
jgi:hypothetical protein